MTWLADLVAGGIWPLQHHTTLDGQWDNDFRKLRFAGRVETGRDFYERLENGTYGPVMGGFLWQTRDTTGEWPRFWSFAAPAVNTTTLDTFPVSGISWAGLERRAEPKRPSYPHEQRFPVGWSSIALTSVNYTQQVDLTAPNFDGVVTQHWSFGELGSPWWDARTGALDPDRASRTQSLARVVMPHNACGGSTKRPYLALQLNETSGGYSGGFVADMLTGGGTRTKDDEGKQILAALSHNRGGFVHVGSANDKHQRAINQDGEPLNPAHLWIGGKWTDGEDRDAPMDFSPIQYEPPESFPFLARTYLRYDPNSGHFDNCGVYDGLWRWETEVPHTKILEDPKEDGEVIERDPTGGAGGSGSDGGTVERPPKIGEVNKLRDLYGTCLELAAPAQAWTAQHYGAARFDTRNSVAKNADADREFRRRPVVMRSDAYGHQRLDDFVRASAGKRSRLRYIEADTASGGVVDMPPELGMEMLTTGAADAATYSTTYRVAWNVRSAWATPDPTTGGVKNGFMQYLSPGAAVMQWDHVDSSGTATNTMAVRSDGLFQHGDAVLNPADLTAQRSFVWPDQGGRIALQLDPVEVTGSGGTTNAVKNTPYGLDVSSSGQEITLPEIGVDCVGGDWVTVKDRKGSSATNNITVTCNGSDEIEEDSGNASETLSTDYVSRTYVAVEGASGNYWMRV